MVCRPSARRACATRSAPRSPSAYCSAVMLVGLAILIRAHHVVPRGGVTILAQLTAGAFGTGWPFYVSNLAVALVLALAANTSFGGLPVLMSLLAKDNRLPHLFYLRAERAVYRYGIAALGLAALLLVIAVEREDRPADPAVHDRRIRRLHHQPGRSRAPLAREAPSHWRCARASTAPARR